MKYFVLFFLNFVASLAAPFDDVKAAAEANGIFPKVIPSLDLNTRLFVNYSQPAGNYTNCDTLHIFPAGMTRLNDTGITYATPWYLRSYRPTPAGGELDLFRYVPEIVWDAKNDTMYTLMMVDPVFDFDPTNPYGPYVQHYMVINIWGSNISTGDVVNRLLGPGPSDLNYHKYVFVVYEQKEMLNLTANQTTAIEARINFNVSTFLIEHNLGSARGINWVYAKGDSWGPVEQDILGLSHLDCFTAVEAAAMMNGIVPSVIPSLNLTTHLAVHYHQPAGNYTNCDQMYLNPAAHFDLNDTGVTWASPWNARSYRPAGFGPGDYFMYQPDVSWATTDNTTLYSLLMVDAGHSVNSTFTSPFIEHWMVVNIPGSNISRGELINPLLGPAPIDVPFVHVYTFILYQQTGYLTLQPEERAAIQTRRQFDLTAFAKNHSLNAPIGVNWMYSMGDSWSPVVQDALNISKLNCLANVEKAAELNNIVPLIVPWLNLTTRLSINYAQPDGGYTNCGEMFNFPSSNFSLNDTGTTIQTPWQVRSYRPTPAGPPGDVFRYVPSIVWTPQVATFYTLLMVDPLFILNETHQWGPYVEHYMVLNIIGNNVSSGDTINQLLGPAPTDPTYHKYLFLLYAQAGKITLDKNETDMIQTRVNFDLKQFLMKHKYPAGAAGINWVYAKSDSWSPVELDMLHIITLDCFGAVEEAATVNGIVPTVIPSLNLTTRLNVRYNQPAGSYLSCGTEYDNGPANFKLNDTAINNSTTISNTPWNLRSFRPTPAGAPDDFFQYQPEVSWISEPNALYTLMMLDPVFVVNATHAWGPYVQHWMIINIPGNDTSKGDLVNPLLGPGPNEVNTFHKYTFVLYRQSGQMTVNETERDAIKGRVNFNLPSFLLDHQLSGAAGVNWVYSMVDPWALVQLDTLRFLDLNCFGAVQNAANYLGIVPAIIPALDLTTQLRVLYTQPVGTYSNCDITNSPPAFNRSLSDTDVSLVYQQPWDLRSYRPGTNKTKDVVSYTPAITWSTPSDYQLYSLLVVDPVYILNPQDPAGPFVNHLMVLNINGSDLRTGKVINSYFGPAPLDALYHKYLFLLYRQTGMISLTEPQITKLQTRRMFNLPDFVQNHTLGNPVGVNWVFAQADLWSPVAQDAIGFKPLKCPAVAPTPSSDPGWIHLSTGAFAAIIVILGLIILALAAFAYSQRSKRRVGTDYNPLPGEGVRKTSVNRK